MSTLTIEATDSTLDFDAPDEQAPIALTPDQELRFAIAYADLPEIQRLVADMGIDLRNQATRPAGIAFSVIKHLGPRKTSAQHAALTWFCENGLYDDNYKLKAVVQRMIADGVAA